MAKIGANCAQFVSTSPKTENGPYLGLLGSKPNSQGTYSTRNPPIFVVSKHQISPNETPRRHHGLKTGQKHLFERPKWSRNNFGKNHFFRPRAPGGPTVGPHRARAALPSSSTK